MQTTSGACTGQWSFHISLVPFSLNQVNSVLNDMVRVLYAKKPGLTVDKQYYDSGSVCGWIQASFLQITQIRAVWAGGSTSNSDLKDYNV